MDYNNDSEDDFIISESGEIYTKRGRDWKGVWIPKEIWLCKNLSCMEKILLFEIDSLAKIKGCFASNEYFMNFFDCKERSIQQAISKLKKLGLIKQVGFDGRKRFLKANLGKIAYLPGRKLQQGEGCRKTHPWDAEKCIHNSTSNSTTSFKQLKEVCVSHETPSGKKVLTSGKGKRLTEKQKEDISAKLALHPFATKAISFWNTLPNVTHHNKPSKTWLNVIKSLNMLKLGKLYKKPFNKDFLKKYNIPEDKLKFEFSKQEIIITLKKVSEWCQQGFLKKDKVFRTSLPDAIYNSQAEFYQSIFLIACSNDLKSAVQKIENKFPETTDYFQKKTKVTLNDKELNQLCRILNSLFEYHQTYITKKAIGYRVNQLFGDFKSMCKTFVDWLVDSDKTRNIDKDFKYSVFGFKPDSIMFKKFIKYYEKTINCCLSPLSSRF